MLDPKFISKGGHYGKDIYYYRKPGLRQAYRAEKINCHICGVEFWVRASDMLYRVRTLGHTPACSPKCSNPNRRVASGWAKQVELTCKSCGKKFTRSAKAMRTRERASIRERGRYTGPFCSRSCAGKSSKPRDGRARYLDDHGYAKVLAPGHPTVSNKNRYVFEHRLVMEKLLGRYLRAGETVHHKNGVKDDNRPENLELWTSNHPKGQRVSDIIKWCKEFLAEYDKEPTIQ